ncbi:MAG: tRNA (adenosine(37)-N6)-threonylcarbamoyltransferase complex dimerization subunit type 1 TsaB [Actinomycetota bacterium]|nr:tRNA (adenosine(37)-N6)-threonylcarbamoyltransferase complex dimerization subunit type 1 TsaB [Actinomycetota bacterium]
MVMLAVDTSSAATSVALLDGDDLIAHEVHVDARNHAEVLAVMVERALLGAGRPRITAVSCGVGPGAYTGLRVGVSSAQAYGLGWEVPVYGVCSLDAMALAASDAVAGPFACAIDARRREIYWAQYDATGSRMQGPFVTAPNDIDGAVRELPWFGDIAMAYAEQLHSESAETVPYPDARDIGRFALHHLGLGQAIDLTQIELSVHGHDLGATAAALLGHSLLRPLPLYVRRPDAVEPVR